jgi:hypothetical protein
MDCWGMKNHPCKYMIEKVVPVVGARSNDSVNRFWDQQLRSLTKESDGQANVSY